MWKAAREGWTLCVVDALIRRPLGERTDIPIAAAGQGLDPTIAARHLREHASDRIDLRREVAFLDNDVWPNRIDDPRFGRDAGRMLDQRRENANRVQSQCDGRAGLCQRFVRNIQPERTQIVDFQDADRLPMKGNVSRGEEGPREGFYKDLRFFSRRGDGRRASIRHVFSPADYP